MTAELVGFYRNDRDQHSAVAIATHHGTAVRVRWKATQHVAFKCDTCGKHDTATCAHARAAVPLIVARLERDGLPIHHTLELPAHHEQPEPTTPTALRLCPDCQTQPARDQRPGRRDGRCHPCWDTTRRKGAA